VLNKLSRLLDEAGISLTDHQKNQLVAYVGMLDKWNKAYNLTSVRDPDEMLVRHILDSIVVAPYLKGTRFIDVGTGPGLPGSRWLSCVLNPLHPAGQSGQASTFSSAGPA
jgi:16S rRNA (guanine527-N7)-methyltransferase